MRKTSAKGPREGASHPREGASQSGDGLAVYRQKRDPLSTSEPFSVAEHKLSDRATRVGRFVAHLHDATRPHYDLRLQIGSTLKSFAVPKGPSLNPKDKRLAIHTEDHPLEYLDFENVIPEGNYGAGAMIAWDVGRVRYLEGSAEEGLERGKLDFELDGFKLRGRFALIATGKRKASASDPKKAAEWLLVKKEDAFVKQDESVIEQMPESVFSGLTVAELATKQAVVARLLEQAERSGAARAEVDVQHEAPMLCAITEVSLEDPERVYELKLDGVRIVADKHDRAVALRYRNGRSATASYPEIARAVAAFAPERLVLDGEIVAFDAAGRPSFQRIAPRIHASRPLDVKRAASEVPVSYLVFDLLALGPFDLRALPLLERKRLLLEVVHGRGYVRALDHIAHNGQALYDLCRETHLEGVVAKRASSAYRHGPRRTDDWVKVKCERDDEFVVMGYMPGKGSRGELGALCVGSYAGEALLYRGRVGSGLTRETMAELTRRLTPLEIAEFPGHGTPPEDSKGAHWVRPELCVSVRFLGFTEDVPRLRAPVFRGIRDDISPHDCRAAPAQELIDLELAAQAKASPLGEPTGEPSDDASVDGDKPEADSADGARSALAGAKPHPLRVTISNRDKVFWPDEGYTKGDLCAYYAAIAPVMLPFLRDRPVVLVRYPDGITGKHFYQWNVPQGTPDWIRRLEIEDPDDPGHTKKTLFLLDDVDALVHIANLGCIPLHVLAARADSLDTCDFLTVDFDIGELPFELAVKLALDLRSLLEGAGLIGFPKTSGQRGLHVLVPLGNGVSFETAKLLVELLGRLVTAKNPKISTMERRVNKRGPRVYVDTGQTGPSRTIVAPYSVRAYPGATVSMPLRWEELHIALDTSRFTMLSSPGRVAEIGDPFAGFFDSEPDVAAAVEHLGSHL